MMRFLKWLLELLKKDKPTPEVVMPKEPLPEIPTSEEIKDFGFVIRSLMLPELKKTCEQIMINQERYLAVEKGTGVPWKVVAACHYRESSLDFRGCLHNGDPWNKVTVHVPKGRGPFSSWVESAIDAMTIERKKFPQVWDMAGQFYFCERYNGMGYSRKGLPSPYVWAGTDKYKSGLYVADGKFSSTAIDKRLGCAAIIVSL
jgi:lysozyme family protein